MKEKKRTCWNLLFKYDDFRRKKIPHNFGRTWPIFFPERKKKKQKETLGKKSITRGVKIPTKI
jgi:hypothetical protein